jgi:hypothetical protein
MKLLEIERNSSFRHPSEHIDDDTRENHIGHAGYFARSGDIVERSAVRSSQNGLKYFLVNTCIEPSIISQK